MLRQIYALLNGSDARPPGYDLLFSNRLEPGSFFEKGPEDSAVSSCTTNTLSVVVVWVESPQRKGPFSATALMIQRRVPRCPRRRHSHPEHNYIPLIPADQLVHERPSATLPPLRR